MTVKLPAKVLNLAKELAKEEGRSEEEVISQAVAAYTLDKHWGNVRKEGRKFVEGLRRELSAGDS